MDPIQYHNYLLQQHWCVDSLNQSLQMQYQNYLAAPLLYDLPSLSSSYTTALSNPYICNSICHTLCDSAALIQQQMKLPMTLCSDAGQSSVRMPEFIVPALQMEIANNHLIFSPKILADEKIELDCNMNSLSDTEFRDESAIVLPNVKALNEIETPQESNDGTKSCVENFSNLLCLAQTELASSDECSLVENQTASIDVSKSTMQYSTLDDDDYSDVSPNLSASMQQGSQNPAKNREQCKYEKEFHFVDVESICDKNFAREQRKSLIDFYRRIKALVQRGKTLECQVCKNKIANYDHSLRTHIYRHSSGGLYRCKVCGVAVIERDEIFAHMRRFHWKLPDVGFHDARNMTDLCGILEKCFPKVAAKTKNKGVESLKRFIKDLDEKPSTVVSCKLCEKEVAICLDSISRHALNHPIYRCKNCKEMSPDKESIIQHCRDAHSNALANSKDYYLCNSGFIMFDVLRKCFPLLFPHEAASIV